MAPATVRRWQPRFMAALSSSAIVRPRTRRTSSSNLLCGLPHLRVPLTINHARQNVISRSRTLDDIPMKNSLRLLLLFSRVAFPFSHFLQHPFACFSFSPTNSQNSSITPYLKDLQSVQVPFFHCPALVRSLSFRHQRWAHC